jgi:hypothetical protein
MFYTHEHIEVINNNSHRDIGCWTIMNKTQENTGLI